MNKIEIIAYAAAGILLVVNFAIVFSGWRKFG